MIKIIAVHFENGKEHKHITKIKWENTETNEVKTATISDMITFLAQNPGTVFVEDEKGYIIVHIIDDSPKYLRTKKDGRLTNNLLNLDKF